MGRIGFSAGSGDMDLKSWFLGSRLGMGEVVKNNYCEVFWMGHFFVMEVWWWGWGWAVF